MLTICRRASIRHKKYHPRKLELCWVVVRTISGACSQTVFGPSTHAACNRFIKENNK